MSKIFEKIDNGIETFLVTLKRFPLASFSAFLITIILLILTEYSSVNQHPNLILASKVAFVSTLGLVLFPALQLLGRSILLPILGLAGLIAYFYFLPANPEEAGQTVFIRHLLLFLGLFFMIFWAPFIGRKSDNSVFWQYALTILFGLIAAIFFSFLLYGGLAIAFYAIETLFHVQIISERYLQLFIIIFGIFGVNFFLSQIPKYPLFMETPAYTNIKRVLTKHILTPLTILYFIILFAYSAKILITFSWPESTLSWIIVAFCLVAIITFLFLTPYLKNSTLTKRLIWLAILLQTLMLGMALWIRIEEYGITYNRYLLALLGVWLLLISFYFILFGKWAQQKWLFFTASMLILFSQFGPYSAKNITQKNQTERLIALIETAHPRSEELDLKRKYEVSSTISYIHDHYGLEAFEGIIPHILKKYQTLQKNAEKEHRYVSKNFPHFATNELGFKYLNRWDWERLKNQTSESKGFYSFYQAYSHKKYLNVKEYDWLINFSVYQEPNIIHFTDNGNNLSIMFNEQKFNIQKDANRTIEIDMSRFANNLLTYDKYQTELSSEQMTYTHETNESNFKVNFNNLTVTDDGQLKDFEATILFKIKE